MRGAGPTGGGTGRVIGGFLPRLSFGQSSEKTRTAACMNCMQVSIGPGVRIDRSCPSARRAAGGCWLGVLLLLGLLVLGRWGAQPGGVRPGGVSTLPPLSTVVLRHTPVAGAFKMDMMAIEDAGGDDDDAPTETQRDEAVAVPLGVAPASVLQQELEAAQGQHRHHVEAKAEAARAFASASATHVHVSKTLQTQHDMLASCEESRKARAGRAKSRLEAEFERALAAKFEEFQVEYGRRLRRIDEDDAVRKRSFCPFFDDHLNETGTNIQKTQKRDCFLAEAKTIRRRSPASGRGGARHGEDWARGSDGGGDSFQC